MGWSIRLYTYHLSVMLNVVCPEQWLEPVIHRMSYLLKLGTLGNVLSYKSLWDLVTWVLRTQNFVGLSHASVSLCSLVANAQCFCDIVTC